MTVAIPDAMQAAVRGCRCGKWSAGFLDKRVSIDTLSINIIYW